MNVKAVHSILTDFLWYKGIGFRSIYFSIRNDLACIISSYVGWIKRICGSCWDKLCLSNIWIIISVISWRPMSFFVSLLRFTTWNIIYFIWGPSLKMLPLIFSWTCPFIVYCHWILNEFRRGWRPDFHTRQLVNRILRVISNTFCLKLYTIRLSSFYILT